MAKGEYRKARIMFTCEHDIKEKLQTWADSENRTLSNLMELLAEQAIAARETKEKKL
jgi:hypothetical protein